MILRLKWLLWLACLGVMSAVSAQTAAPAPSPWLGVWSADMPGYGVVALSITDAGQDQSLKVEVWWLFSEVMPATALRKFEQSARPRVEGDTLYFERLDHTNEVALPGLGFRLVAPNEMRLVSYGVLHPIMAPVWANLVLRKDPSRKAWFDRSENSTKLSGWRRYGNKGENVPVPATWTADVVMPTALLFSANSVLFTKCISQSDLPAGFLRQVAGLAENAGWHDSFTDSTFQALAQNPHTPVDVLDRIWAYEGNLRIWYLTAAHPNARPNWRAEVVERVMRLEPDRRDIAAAIEVGPEEVFRRLIADGPERRQTLARNIDLPDSIYLILAEKYLPETAATLARNPGVPVRLLEVIATMDDRKIKFQIILNKSVTEETHRKVVASLAATAVPAEYDYLVHDKFIPAAFLAKCAASPSSWIRIQAAANPQVDEATLAKLAEDEVRVVAKRSRELLHERFPAAFAAREPTWVPLVSLRDEDLVPQILGVERPGK